MRGRHPHNFARAGGALVAAALEKAKHTVPECEVCHNPLGDGIGQVRVAVGKPTRCYECAIYFDPPQKPKPTPTDAETQES